MESMNTTMASGMMMPYLHFTLGDMLWFNSWDPKSKGALAGACIGLFILTLIDRWLAAHRAIMEARWRDAALLAAKKLDDVDNKGKVKKMKLRAPPFNPAHDITRGVIHAAQSLLGFAFMLAVMTFQAAYLITLVLGLGIGQMLFGRYGAAVMAH
ncbi:CTR copper uptake transporter [Mycena sanguinolenta]|uniref:Copper transport protein n=1 Tax=Mycena sanguinolenta TaxID=230812 RepID=A0A8H6YAB8_9AGAR|nr:CTR copper uptake transporter [Mycena sanguinolenta]